MENFKQLNLPEAMIASLERMNFLIPTPIQAKAVPLALAGRDILGSAQTGTGKTGAFAIPLMVHLMNKQASMGLILAPTRELAVQITKAIQQMRPSSAIRTATLIGGESMQKQYMQLRSNPRIIIGTPGRINDHLERRTLNLSTADFLILDETDRMLDMGFGIQIEKIIRTLPRPRQTLMFSATLPHNITKLSSQYLSNPERIAVGETHTAVPKIRQETVQTSSANKYKALVEQIKQRTGSIIIFVKTKHGADRLTDKLNREEHSADTIHGNLKQSRRDRVIQNFRDKKHRIMVATDVAARGLDIPHIESVINYDLPQCPEDYIHRIGRTGRAGAEGVAVSLIAPEDNAKWRAIMRLMNPGEKVSGFEGGDAPRGNNRRPHHGKPHRKGGFKRPEGRDFKRADGDFKRPARPEGGFKRRDNNEGGHKRFERKEGGHHNGNANRDRGDRNGNRSENGGGNNRHQHRVGGRPNHNNAPRTDRPERTEGEQRAYRQSV